MKDYRKPEHRLEGFLKYYYAILLTEEYDPAYYTLRYLFERYELNVEQRFWMSWLYGFIYNVATAWVVWNEFPDFENVDFDRLKAWEDRNWTRMVYETDTRYKKGKLQVSFPDYQARVRSAGSQREFFKGVCSSPDKLINFRNLWNEVNDFKLFGRYSTFFYTETLKECNGLPIEADSLFLRDIEGSKSHRNGLCYSICKDEWDYHKSNPSFTGYTQEMLDFLELKADEVLGVMKERFPTVAHKVDYFTAETAWCAYKGFYRRRRYLGFYLDRDCFQIKEAESKGWNGIDWKVFWQCRQENLRPEMLCENKGYYAPSDRLKDHFLDTGEIVNLNLFFPEDECKFDFKALTKASNQKALF